MNTKELNRIYRLIWSEVQQAWIAVAETTRGRGKQSGSLRSAALSVTAASLLLFGPLSYAAPTGGQVVSGSALITESGSAGQSTTTITQSSNKLSLGWQSFNVGAFETVNFVQPSASALAVNRIYDTQGSQILGRINANGQVWLINPNGVLFGQGAQINVGALVASTLDTSDASLGQASQRFSGNSTASVVNLGQINAAQGGYVALLGHSVINQGSLSAPGGTLAMGAGSAVSLSFAGSKLLGLQVEQNQLNALAANGGLIQADGGQVLLSAGARDSLLASVVNNTGIVQARTVQEQGGKIILLGGMAAGTTHVDGTLDASAPNPDGKGGDGGFIETSAHTVHVADSARITTASAKGKQGQWLIDPYDFYIAASGGNITGDALGKALNSNSVTIQTTDTGTSYAGTTSTGGTSGNGDIFVNDAVKWGGESGGEWFGGTTLTLNAWRNININAPITASNAAGKLALLYGQGSNNGVVGGTTASYAVNAPVNLKAGNNFSTKLGLHSSTVNYTVITALGSAGHEKNSTTAAANSLQGLADKSRLKGKYVLGTNIDAKETAGWNSGLGFSPIGNENSMFTGAFDGLGHTIIDLTINRSTNYVGLFGYLSGASVSNVGISGGNIKGLSWVGALAGYQDLGAISKSYSTASVSGTGNFVSGTGNDVGGLVGFNSGSISNSYAAGNVIGSGFHFGGLVGSNNGSISNSYAAGNVIGSGSPFGGLVGFNNGSISNSYASGSVSVEGFAAGGLVGRNESGGSIENSYATGSVSGTSFDISFDIGGLVGQNKGAIGSSYATGSVITYRNLAGGLVGSNESGGSIKNSYATGSVEGPSEVGGLVGSNESGGSIENSYATGSVKGAFYVGGLAGWSEGFIQNSYFNKTTTGQEKGVDESDASGVTGLSTDEMQQSKNFSGFDFGSTWFSYDGHTSPLLRSFLTTLTVTVNASGSKTYDGTTACDTGISCGVSYSGTPDLGKVKGTAYFKLDSKNIGNRNALVSGLFSDQQGYLIKYVQGKTAPITPKPVTISGITAADKTYDGTTSAAVDATKASGWIGTDDVTVTASGSFADKNAASAPKTVNLSSSYSGVDKDNYEITGQASTTASITPKALKVNGTMVANKVYDGNTSAAITVGTLSGFVGEEKVSASASGTFDSKDAGSRTATAKYTLADRSNGGQAANYQLADTTGLSATIEKAPVEKVAAGDATTGVDIKNIASWMDSQNKQSQQAMQAQIITAGLAPVQITQPVLVRSIGVSLPDGAYQKESVVLVPLDIPLTALMLPSLRKLAPDAADKREP